MVYISQINVGDKIQVTASTIHEGLVRSKTSRTLELDTGKVFTIGADSPVLSFEILTRAPEWEDGDVAYLQNYPADIRFRRGGSWYDRTGYHQLTGDPNGDFFLRYIPIIQRGVFA